MQLVSGLLGYGDGNLHCECMMSSQEPEQQIRLGVASLNDAKLRSLVENTHGFSMFTERLYSCYSPLKPPNAKIEKYR